MSGKIGRIIVDECLGQAFAIRAELRHRLGGRTVEFVLVAARHPGIPDVEILDKLLDARSALLTGDRVLHNLTIGRGFQSFFHSPETGLTGRRLAHVDVPDKCLPASNGPLRDSYLRPSEPEVQVIIRSLDRFLPERQLKQFRTKRRRIRAHFGSPGNIAATALTVAQRCTGCGVIGGYMLKIDAGHGIKGLAPASESYFADQTSGSEPLLSTCWALMHLFRLQLQSYPLTLYHLDGAAAARCTSLITRPASASGAIELMAARLLSAVCAPKVIECVKGASSTAPMRN
jgi:hypothetical protein